MKRLILILFLSLGLIGISNADFQYAADEYYKEDYETALKEFKVLAEQGNAKAQIYLSMMHEYGYGVDVDVELAKSWEEKSLSGLKLLAEKGDPEAQYWLGYLMESDNEDRFLEDEAEIWYKKSFNGFLFAANQGDPYAQLWLYGIREFRAQILEKLESVIHTKYGPLRDNEITFGLGFIRHFFNLKAKKKI